MHQREDLGEVDRERRESGITGELRVKCLRDNAMLLVRGTARATGYDINAASGCIIPTHGKGSEDIGLAVSLPPGTYAQIAPRSGLLEDTDRGNDGFGSTGTHSFVQSTQKNQKGKKKKSPSPSHPRSQQRQAHGSINTVESTKQGSSDLNRVIREPINVEEIVFSDSDLGKATVWVRDSLLGMESSSRTQKWRRTPELAVKVGSRLMRILVDSGSTGNYIDARECAVRKLQIENDETT